MIVVIFRNYNEASARIHHNSPRIRFDWLDSISAEVQTDWIRRHLDCPVIGILLRKWQPKDLTFAFGRVLFDIITTDDELRSWSYVLRLNIATSTWILNLLDCFKIVGDVEAENALFNDAIFLQIVYESIVPWILRWWHTDKARWSHVRQVLRLVYVQHLVLIAAATLIITKANAISDEIAFGIAYAVVQTDGFVGAELLLSVHEVGSWWIVAF